MIITVNGGVGGIAKFCPECGSPINDSKAIFCQKCRTKLPVTSPESQTPKNQPFAVQQPQPVVDIPPVITVPVKTSVQRPLQQIQDRITGSTTKGRSTLEWIAIICGGFILLVVITAFLAGMASVSTPNSGSRNTTQTSTNPIGTGHWTQITAYAGWAPGNSDITIFKNQTLTYPIASPNATRILPNSNTNLPSTGLNISQNTTPGEYEASSFVVQPQSPVSDMTVLATSLTDGTNTIPTSAIDIKGVKVWYMAKNSDTSADRTSGYYLRPELLLKNLSIVRVNYTAQTNELWITNATYTGYFHIDNTTIGQFPTDVQIWDNATATGNMQPFSVPAGNNQQIWVTTDVPAGQRPGIYNGQIWINSSVTNPVAMNFSVNVLPYTLPASSLRYGIYFTPVVGTTDPASWSPDNGSFIYDKIPAREYAAELTDMKNHGVLYPTDYNWWGNIGTQNYANFERSLLLRNQSGLPTDSLYTVFGPNYGHPRKSYLLATSQSDLNTIAAQIKSAQNQSSTYGFNKLYLYGVDEPDYTQFPLERPAFTTEITNGSYPYYADGSGHWGVGLPAINVTSLINLAGATNSTNMALYRSSNPNIQLFRYADPQSGIPNPEIYRKNFGLSLWNDGYNGSMDWAYMMGRGQSIWNNFDNTKNNYTEENFVYPKSDGVIDTIQWEGFREGIDDTRYADYLTQFTGSTSAAKSTITSGIAAREDMSQIRATLINQIGSVSFNASLTSNITSNLLPLSSP
jgi:hypothetical protein